MANDNGKLAYRNGASNDGNYRGDGAVEMDDVGLLSGRADDQRTGGTWAAQGADSGKLAPPGETMSDRNGPSDPPGDKKRPS